MHHGQALGSSDKAKPKTVRPGSLLVNSVRGPVRPDSPKSSQGGKLLVLKPNREVNGISPTLKDNLASSTKVPHNSASISPSAGSGSNNSKYTKPVADRKSPVLSAGQIFDEKRTSTQGQNRTEFFNSLRRKTANATTSSVQPNHGLPSNADKLEVQDGEVASVDRMKDIHDADIEPAMQDNGDVCEESISILDDGKKDDDLHGISVVAPEEEEAAFLRSLGWDEGAGEEALTEEEINSFYEVISLPLSISSALAFVIDSMFMHVYHHTENSWFSPQLMKQRPSASFHQRVQYFKDGTSEPNAISSAGSTSGLSSSDSETDG